MKPKYQYALWVKTLAFVLLLLSLLTAACSGMGLLYGYHTGAYSGRNFWTSGIAAETMWHQLHLPESTLLSYFRTQVRLAEQTGMTQEEADLASSLHNFFDPAANNLRLRYVRKASETAPERVYTLGEAATDSAFETLYTSYVSDQEQLVYGAERSLPARDALHQQAKLFTAIQQSRDGLTAGLIAGGLLTLLCTFYLLLACGHRPDAEGRFLRWCDRIPYGIVLCTLAVPFSFGIACFAEASYTSAAIPFLIFLLGGILLLFWSSFFLLMTTTARCKAHALWHTTLTYHIYSLMSRGVGRVKTYSDQRRTERLEARSVPALSDSNPSDAEAPAGRARRMDALRDKASAFRWQDSAPARALHHAGRGFRRLSDWLRARLRAIRAGFTQLSLTRQGALAALAVIALGLVLALLGGIQAEGFLLLLLWGGAVLLLLLTILGQMSILQAGAQKLAQGDLDYRIPLHTLRGPFRRHAELLGAISDGMSVAVEHRLKSEKMKTELLTNVSHDIKTPLTSIINYVDLLQKTDLQPAQAREYAQVLERQSLRLKKLLEDLIEASKASTGNINAELAPTDAAELLRQATGEYSERFKQNHLSPVIRIGAADCTIIADGRLLWRVFDNLLGNIVKYALPGTRVYLDIAQEDAQIQIAIKNISREALNIDTEELMERFVRGDAARASEGSGLGLSIARSLTECMGGSFALAIDGDLFKATLRFPMPDSGKEAS